MNAAHLRPLLKRLPMAGIWFAKAMNKTSPAPRPGGLLCALLCLLACSTPLELEPYPFAFVNKLIDLNNLSYQGLRLDRGFVYEDGGIRGLIIYRRSANSYLVFDRACAHRPSNECERVAVDASGLFMQCACCRSVFDFEGQPTAGPAPRPLLRYRTALSGSLLSISN